MLLSKEQMLSATTLRTEDVEAFGGTVRLLEMTGNIRDEYEMYMINSRKDGNKPKMLRATLLVFLIVDDKGNRIFDENDIQSLGERPINDIQRLYNKAVVLNALSEGDMKTLEGNSKSVPSEDSTTS